ncbi:hypothetical protein AAE478_000281 [Parahypoxylon ruwenzoriense]
MAALAAPKSVDAIAIKAQGVDAINAALNKITTTIAGVWDLDTGKKETPDASNSVFIPHKNPGSESVIEADDRKTVGAEHFAPGAILKLFIRYEGLGENKFAHGTGWLIRPDVMITAGHNVFTWRAGGGRAREIVAYAGYNGASSINDPSVESRKAKRVVTTSQWLSHRGSMAHDFAMVMFDRPFTNATPFQYIETPPKGRLELGVVGYPADKIDPVTSERGGKMYELFENTEYNIMEQKDTMLQHYIDSEGGNSGGPVLRGSDLCGIATHVYGGDFNTASILGRYGNPVQDYIAAFDLPLANPGQVNLIPVTSNHICQQDAATGPQASEIAKLGDNITTTSVSNLNGHANGANGASGEKASKTEFWIFEGADEIIRLTQDIAAALGPAIAGPAGAVIVPAIVRGIKLAQPSGRFDMDAALRRALLANSTLLVSEQKARHGPVIKLPFKEIMVAIGVVGDAAERLVHDVASEVTRGLLLRAEIPDLSCLAKAESSMDVDSIPAAAAAENEVAFAQQLVQATRASKEEGIFDDIGDFFKGAADSTGDVVSDGARIVGKTVLGGVDVVVDAAHGAADVVSQVPVVGEVFGTAIREDPALRMLEIVGRLGRSAYGESALDADDVRAESLFENLGREIGRVAQALILHQVLADAFLAKQMERPAAELREEGFFDDVGDFFRNRENLARVAAGLTVVGSVAPVVPIVGPIVGLGLIGVGAAAAIAS